jgi:hypothetical protein
MQRTWAAGVTAATLSPARVAKGLRGPNRRGRVTPLTEGLCALSPAG